MSRREPFVVGDRLELQRVTYWWCYEELHGTGVGIANAYEFLFPIPFPYGLYELLFQVSHEAFDLTVCLGPIRRNCAMLESKKTCKVCKFVAVEGGGGRTVV